jgi:hypothetical protein
MRRVQAKNIRSVMRRRHGGGKALMLQLKCCTICRGSGANVGSGTMSGPIRVRSRTM